MSETEGAAEATETEVAQTTEASETTEAPDLNARIAQLEADAKKWQDFSRKNEAAAKAAAKELEKARQAQMSDVERATATAQDAEKRAAEAERALIRYRVAAAKSVPADLIDRLRGDTEEEMAADADALLKLIKPAAPKPDASQGNRTSATATPDMNTLLRSAAGRV